MTAQLKNLAFGGTGVRNVAACAGALLALQERGLYRDISGFAGASTGAIVAALAGVGYSPEQVLERIIELDFARIPGGTRALGPARLLFRFGWFDADYLIEQLQAMIAEKTGDPLASIARCEYRSGHRIRVVGVNVSQRIRRVFPDATSRHIPLAEAVRISMSVPLLFEAPRFEGELYADGAVLGDAPVEIWSDEGEPSDSSLGFTVREAPDAHPRRITRPGAYYAALLRTLAKSQQREFAGDRVVEIEDLGISPLQFKIGQAQKWALVDAGRVATHRFLDRTELGPSPAVDRLQPSQRASEEVGS